MASRFKRQRVEASKPKTPEPPPAFGDEDDYLSALFVAEQPNKPRGKRLQQAPDPERGRLLSKKDIAKKMEDQREEGLKQKIGEENAGFKLLMKLGYKGGGLGKDGGGTADPLKPELKQGRGGLGKESQARKKKEEQKERAQQRAAQDTRHEVQRREHFRLSKAAQFVDRRLQQDLVKCRRLVESLDEAKDRPRSIMWPDEVKADESDRDALAGGDRLGEDWERDVDDTQSAGAGGTVLAIEASRGDDDGDMSRASDEGEAIRAEEDEMGPEGGLQEEWDMMTTDEKLSACLAYLRASHLYCMFCACQYTDAKDLHDNCPGPSRDDHDEEEM